MIASRRRLNDGHERNALYGFKQMPTPRRLNLLSGRSLLAIWAALSSIWAMTVGYEVCHEVSVQADMSRDVERDLDNISFASCTDSNCAAANATKSDGEDNRLTESWSNIASTYIKFGSLDMAASALGPPAAILVAGLGWILISRRRQRSNVDCPMIDRQGFGA